MKFYCRPKAQEKQHFGKSHFYCRRFFPGNTVTIILGFYPPSTLQGVGLGARKNPRIIVGENCCHFGASYHKNKARNIFAILSLHVSCIMKSIAAGPLSWKSRMRYRYRSGGIFYDFFVWPDSGPSPPLPVRMLLQRKRQTLTPAFFRAARLQNEIAPEKLLNRYEKRFEKREKGSEKRSETRLKKF